MIAFLSLLLHVVVSPFKTKARLEAEIILLRHQLNVLRRRFPSNPKLVVADRLLFVWLYRLFRSVMNAVTIIRPETIVRWHRTGFRLYWRWKSRSRGGRASATYASNMMTDRRTFPAFMLAKPSLISGNLMRAEIQSSRCRRPLR